MVFYVSLFVEVKFSADISISDSIIAAAYKITQSYFMQINIKTSVVAKKRRVFILNSFKMRKQ